MSCAWAPPLQDLPYVGVAISASCANFAWLLGIGTRQGLDNCLDSVTIGGRVEKRFSTVISDDDRKTTAIRMSISADLVINVQKRDDAGSFTHVRISLTVMPMPMQARYIPRVVCESHCGQFNARNRFHFRFHP